MPDVSLPPVGELVQITTVASGRRLAWLSDERGWWWKVAGVPDEAFLLQEVTAWQRVLVVPDTEETVGLVAKAIREAYTEAVGEISFHGTAEAAVATVRGAAIR